MNRKKRLSISNIGRKMFILSAIIFVFGSVILNAYESKINADIQRIEKANKEITASIDGLEIEIANKTDFQYLSQVATQNGYTYRGDQTASAYIADNQ